jgi:hypothetical protein
VAGKKVGGRGVFGCGLGCECQCVCVCVCVCVVMGVCVCVCCAGILSTLLGSRHVFLLVVWLPQRVWLVLVVGGVIVRVLPVVDGLRVPRFFFSAFSNFSCLGTSPEPLSTNSAMGKGNDPPVEKRESVGFR